MSEDPRVLVGDVGGTHARFAVVDTAAAPWRIDNRVDLDTDFSDFVASLRAYLDRAGLASLPKAVAIAVAGPVTAGSVVLTNRNWKISEDDLRAFGFADALLVNDFAALAFAVGALPAGSFHVIGPDLAGLVGEPISVLGAGTGFGAACLARFHGRAVPVATEGGHVGFAPGDDREADVLKVLARRFGHVSVERVLSGPGMENLHSALAALDGRPPSPLSAAEIVARHESDPLCRETVDMFCAIYGTVAGDFALAHGARGGVFLAGGIAQKIEPVLQASSFRARFERKGRLSGYVTAIPTRLILSEDTAFLGVANASREFRGDIRTVS
ncbi:MAG: glucokinase [Rhizomicrobium sp.]